ncbi:hypothetical protein WDZ92_51580, partial [Nostoc sp. NIES-2111]
MDREKLQKRLEEAERHVVQDARHFVKQELRISELVCLGQDTIQARKLLDYFYTSQVQHFRHRDRIVPASAEEIPPPDAERTEETRRMVIRDIEE